MSLSERIKKIIPYDLLLAVIVIYIVALPYFIVCYAWGLFSLFLPSHIYQAVEDRFYYLHQRCGLFVVETILGVKLVLHGDVTRVLAKKERVLYISNHQSAVDWIVVNMLASRQGTLPHVRYVLKNSLQYVPIYGFIVYLHNCIFVNRGNFKSEKMLKSLKYLRNKKIPSWIVIYPEGTRYTLKSPTTLQRSMRYASQFDLKPFKQVLFPRYRGFHMIMENMKERLDAVYDVTLVYSNTKGDGKDSRKDAPTFAEFLGSACNTIHVHVNRIGINDVPKQEEEVKDWLWKLFDEKDSLLESYYSSNLPTSPDSSHPWGKGVVSPPSVILNALSWLLFMTASTYLLLTPMGRWMYIYFLTLGSIVGYVWKLTDILITQYRRRWKQKEKEL